MSADTSAGTPAPENPATESHLLQVRSDKPIRATIRTIDVPEAKLIALEILRRHEALSTFHELRSESRAASSRSLIFLSMIFVHGVTREHCSGLIVTASTEEIGDTFGLKAQICYPALRELETAGMIRRIRRGRGHDHFEVLMPVDDNIEPMPAHNDDGGASKTNDLDYAGAQAEVMRARAPVRARALDPNIDYAGARACAGARAGESSNLRFPLENADDYAGARAGLETLHCNDSSSKDTAIATLQSAGSEGGTTAAERPPAPAKTPEERRQLTAILMRIGFDPKAANFIAGHRNCTKEQIKAAWERCQYCKRTGALRPDPRTGLPNELGYIRRHIEKKWAPPPSDVTLLTRDLPEMDALDAATQIINDRLTKARSDQLEALIMQLPDEWVNAQMQELIRNARNDFERSALMKIAKNNPRANCGRLRDLVAIQFAAQLAGAGVRQ